MQWPTADQCIMLYDTTVSARNNIKFVYRGGFAGGYCFITIVT